MNVVLFTVIVLLYLLVIGYLGYKGYKATKTSEDYMVAGRKIHPYIMALSYGATFISTSAIVGFGGVAGLFGMGLLWLTFLNIFVGIFIAFVVFGKRTRKMGHNLSAHTFPELLAKRFDSRFIQGFSGLVIFLGMPLYASVVLIGAGRFIETTLAVNFDIALLIFSLIIAAYVVLGGLKGVMYTDALQGSIMFIGMAILLVSTYSMLGGIAESHQALTDLADQVPESLAKAGHAGWTAMPPAGSPWWWTLVSTIVLGVGIGVLAQPQLVVRFMTVNSNRELNRAVLIGGVFILMMTGVAFIVGALSNVYFMETGGKIAIASVPEGNSDLIIPTYINSAMPDWFVYIFMLSLLAAGMSTLSSQFHAMGTAIGRDFFDQYLMRGKETQDQSVLVTRIGIILAIIVAVVLGYQLPISIIARGTAIFFGLCAAAFLPAYIGALFWRRMTREGAIASIIAGTAASVFWLVFVHQKESEALGIAKMLFGRDVLFTSMPWPVVDPIVVAFPVALVVAVVVSLATKAPEEKLVDSCFKGI